MQSILRTRKGVSHTNEKIPTTDDQRYRTKEDNYMTFQFSIHNFQFNGNAPQHNTTVAVPNILELDDTEGYQVRVERVMTDDVDEPNKFFISTRLGNDQEIGIRYNIVAWCHDSEVIDHKDVETRVEPGRFTLCAVDLHETLMNIDQTRRANVHLKVFVNIVVTDGTLQDLSDVPNWISFEQREQESELKACDLLLLQFGWFLVAKFIESYTM